MSTPIYLMPLLVDMCACSQNILWVYTSIWMIHMGLYFIAWHSAMEWEIGSMITSLIEMEGWVLCELFVQCVHLWTMTSVLCEHLSSRYTFVNKWFHVNTYEQWRWFFVNTWVLGEHLWIVILHLWTMTMILCEHLSSRWTFVGENLMWTPVNYDSDSVSTSVGENFMWTPANYDDDSLWTLEFWVDTYG